MAVAVGGKNGEDEDENGSDKGEGLVEAVAVGSDGGDGDRSRGGGGERAAREKLCFSHKLSRKIIIANLPNFLLRSGERVPDFFLLSKWSSAFWAAEAEAGQKMETWSPSVAARRTRRAPRPKTTVGT